MMMMNRYDWLEDCKFIQPSFSFNTQSSVCKAKMIVWRNASKEIDLKSRLQASVVTMGQDAPSTSLGAQRKIKILEESGFLSAARTWIAIKDTFKSSVPVLHNLYSILCSNRSDEELQGELIDMFGVENFDLVSDVIDKRRCLVHVIQAVEYKTTGQCSLKNENNQSTGFGRLEFTSQIEKRAKSVSKRERQKTAKINANFLSAMEAFDVFDTFSPHTTSNVLSNKDRNQPYVEPISTLRELYPYVFDQRNTSAVVRIPVHGSTFCLPEGTKRSSNKAFEMVFVPAADNSNVKGFDRINIQDMDEIAQRGFVGFDKLNVIQSIIFESAYMSKENLLVCAPTGAGKTNIAMLTILNIVREHSFMDHENDFKIIYLTPMKALASEMTATFSKRLEPFGMRVLELTSDTKVSKFEISKTQMLVLTPEKWDVLTRKPGDTSLISQVRLLIIDEVHLLHESRGAVLEAIVARCLRQIYMSQRILRLVGLSATLPNYVDVAKFLKVDLHRGLFFFDERFRPVPLDQTFIGVSKLRNVALNDRCMDEICFEKIREVCKCEQQVLIFVHSRNGTTKLAASLQEIAGVKGLPSSLFLCNLSGVDKFELQKLSNSLRSKFISNLVQHGLGVHHAGLMRHDRNIIEKLFSKGLIRVLICTATLAWGVNLPAHTVIIRGTDVFDGQKGAFSDLGILDVQQIFGRAGRPQYTAKGDGIIITWKEMLPKYLDMLTRQAPIESNFHAHLKDNLNAEISLGTVSNVDEAVEWLGYTYFVIRAKENPQAYGFTRTQLNGDADLRDYFVGILVEAADQLDRNQMIRYDSVNGFLAATDLGRIASRLYITYETIEMLNTSSGRHRLHSIMTDENVLMLIASAAEFKQLKIREEEMDDLENVGAVCPILIRTGTLASTVGKVFTLLQAHISRLSFNQFSLISEMHYVEENAGRICQAMFEIVLRRGWVQATGVCLLMSRCISKRIWPIQTPIRQVEEYVRKEWIQKIESRRLTYYQLFDMSAKDLGAMLSCDGHQLYNAIHMLPALEVDATVKPITNTIIQISVSLKSVFVWNSKVLGGAQSFWIFVENINQNRIVHYEEVIIRQKQVAMQEVLNFVFTIPVHDTQLAENYQVRVTSASFVVDDSVTPIPLYNCIFPSPHYRHTDLLDLDPLPTSVLNNGVYQSLYNFKYFNPIQSQVFFPVFRSDRNLLIGAPTGSGKTLCAELAIFRLLNEAPEKKCVYIAPLKALVRERVLDWREKFEKCMGLRVVELTGDHTPDTRSLKSAKIVITTPEKWDGITREWEVREYVKQVALLIIDEVHLLGVERGSVLEAIITRVKLMKMKRGAMAENYRIVALSTALANAGDIAEWLDVDEHGVYNFRPNVRPVPVEVHIAGFPGNHYCPRMALMNKPAFKAIKTYSPIKPVLIFVASRRQTRLTALALVSHLIADHDPRQWVHMSVEELESYASILKDDNLKLTLPFGIGMHHAGLQQYERNMIEQLFLERKIQILVATATLAWGINMPAHLVIIKGTEYYDGKTHKYIDFPVTDVLQMIGRAGRPQFDDSAVAIIYVQDVKKAFYKRFLYESFPVESSLLQALPNHANAEIHAGTITSKQQLMEYVSSTYLCRRIFANPSYYGVEDNSPECVTRFLVDLVDHTVEELVLSYCVYVDEEKDLLVSTPFGRIASIYYLSYKTVHFFKSSLTSRSTVEDLLKILTSCYEYSEIPVRHNEDIINSQLQRDLPIKLSAEMQMDSPHTKAHLLFQAYFCRYKLQTDYMTDQRSVVEQCIRMIQAMLDVIILQHWFASSINLLILEQMIIQARWYYDHPLLVLPHLTADLLEADIFDATIPMLQSEIGMDRCESIDAIKKKGQEMISEATILTEKQSTDVVEALLQWPILQFLSCKMQYADRLISLNIHQDDRQREYTKVSSGMSYQFFIDVKAVRRCEMMANSSKFPKEKSAGWILLIGDKKTDELIVCRKVPSFAVRKEIRFNLEMPRRRGRYICTIIFASDSYLGIDQEYELCFEIS